MFKRSLKVSLVKDEKTQSTPVSTETTAKVWTEAISHQANKAGIKVMGGVLIYIAADTARKVLIAKATK